MNCFIIFLGAVLLIISLTMVICLDLGATNSLLVLTGGCSSAFLLLILGSVNLVCNRFFVRFKKQQKKLLKTKESNDKLLIKNKKTNILSCELESQKLVCKKSEKQIAQLEKEKTALEDSNSKLLRTIDELEGEIEQLKEQKSETQEEVECIKQELEEKIKSLKKQKSEAREEIQLIRSELESKIEDLRKFKLEALEKEKALNRQLFEVKEMKVTRLEQEIEILKERIRLLEREES